MGGARRPPRERGAIAGEVSLVGDAAGEPSDNLLVRGDSLDALRALVRTPEYAEVYRGKMKLVYIDPPFNAGFNAGQAFEHYDDSIIVFSRTFGWLSNSLEQTDTNSSHYSNPDSDPRGPWFDENPLGSPSPRENLRAVANYFNAANQGMKLLDTLASDAEVFLRAPRDADERCDGGGEIAWRAPTLPGVDWLSNSEARERQVCPPHQIHIGELLTDWESFVNEPARMPLVVKCALMHYQFETIHPFLYGNGRIGRLLIAFMLVSENWLPAPN